MSAKQKKRSEISEQYKWNVAKVFADDGLWQRAYDETISMLAGFEAYKGKLAEADSLTKCLGLREEVCQKLGKLETYASMKHHEDMGVSVYQSMYDKTQGIVVKAEAAMSFIEPEILALDEKLLDEFVRTNAVYKHYIEHLLRGKAHVLSSDAEEILAQASEVASAPYNIFNMMTAVDLKFGTVTDDDGNEIELTRGRFVSLLLAKKQDVRENVFKTFYREFISRKNTFAAAHASSVKADVFFARARRYPSAIEASLFANNIPKTVYLNLIKTVNENLHYMHRYVALRKKRLELDTIHMYDLYTPIVADADTFVSYEDAKETMLKSLEPMGGAYLEIVREGLETGWIDVYENEGKQGGAYSGGFYGTDPYILLNYDNKIEDMFTLAHEMGHSLHSYFSRANQPYIYSDYSTFVAEVASTCNEALMTDYLAKTITDKTQLAYILNDYLEQFRQTFFRQTMFAEFEMMTHELVESDQPLTAENLCRIYHDLNVKYYGPDIVVDEEIDMEWARIPHFYNAFYVFQYATGMAAAMALSQRILNEGEPAVNDYIGFLKSGGSDYPINVLKKAGVDMNTPEPVEAAMRVFGELVEKMEKL